MAYILLVDHESESVEIAAAHLAGEGHRAVVLRDGREALTQVRSEAPTILVTNVLLPNVDGLLLIKELRRQHPKESTAVVLLTATGADGEPVADWSDPPDRCILKGRSKWEMAGMIIKAVDALLLRGPEEPDSRREGGSGAPP